MRSNGGKKYIRYLDEIFTNDLEKRPKRKEDFSGADFEAKIYCDINKFADNIKSKQEDSNDGNLARLVAGFAWDWESRKTGKSDTYDIEIDGRKFRWNSFGALQKGWIGTKKSVDEVGSIFTVQGDDLNYVGLIIGKDLSFKDGKLQYDSKYYKDTGAKKRNFRQIEKGEKLTDDYMLDQIMRTYKILMNRAVKGVYLYVCDEGLREYLSQYFDVIK